MCVRARCTMSERQHHLFDRGCLVVLYAKVAGQNLSFSNAYKAIGGATSGRLLPHRLQNVVVKISKYRCVCIVSASAGKISAEQLTPPTTLSMPVHCKINDKMPENARACRRYQVPHVFQSTLSAVCHDTKKTTAFWQRTELDTKSVSVSFTYNVTLQIYIVR